jgi:tetratricopeptide (TPR) repeat protein
MSSPSRWRPALLAATLGLAGGLARVDAATSPTAPLAPAAPVNSRLDAPLFYQLLIGEMELRAGQPGTAFEVILDAARRTRDEALFSRAVSIALQARAGDQALAATQAWRAALPASMEPLRLQLQILAALNRMGDAGEPLLALIEGTPAADRERLINALPRFLQRAADRQQTAKLLESVLQRYTTAGGSNPAPVATAARVAIARGWLAAGDGPRALTLAQDARQADPAAAGPVLLAIDLMPSQPAAEALVTTYLQQPGADPQLRLIYARVLTVGQRYVDAVQQLEIIIREQPLLAAAHLSLGALQLELRRPKEAEVALLRYVELAQAAPREPVAGPASKDEDDAADDDIADAEPAADPGLSQAWLMLAQIAEQRGDFAAAEGWLTRIEDPQRALEVQTRRAGLLARQGKVDQARSLIREAPERNAGDARAKLVAEAGVLRDVKRWQDAFDVMSTANQRFVDDADLLYEQSMVAEKLDRLDEMERLLRRVIALKPDNAHAHNALGYSLADRGLRLDEAHALIVRALELAPGDPFITDSLGWVEFRRGNTSEALRHLRAAYASRPDPEVAAHLGEVLWAANQRDEARRIWRDAKTRDAGNEVLRETLARLKVEL